VLANIINKVEYTFNPQDIGSIDVNNVVVLPKYQGDEIFDWELISVRLSVHVPIVNNVNAKLNHN
jgi:hypothetical protein